MSAPSSAAVEEPPEFTQWRRARGRLGANARYGRDVDPTEDLRLIKAGQLAEYIERVVNSAPPLTNEQRTQLAMLLRPTNAE